MQGAYYLGVATTIVQIKFEYMHIYICINIIERRCIWKAEKGEKEGQGKGEVKREVVNYVLSV